MFEVARPFGAGNGFYFTRRIEDDLHPRLGIGIHFLNRFVIDDELPVDPVKLDWIKGRFKFVEAYLKRVLMIIKSHKKQIPFLREKVGDVFYFNRFYLFSIPHQKPLLGIFLFN